MRLFCFWALPDGAPAGVQLTAVSGHGMLRLRFACYPAAMQNHPSTSSAAASPAPKPPGRRPKPAPRSSCTKCARVQQHRCAPDRRLRRARLLQQLPLRRPRAQRRRPAARGNAALRLADHARGRSRTSCRPAARWRSTATRFSDAVTAAIHNHPNITIDARGDRRPAAGRLAQRHHRHRPADLAGPGRGDPAR